MARWPSGPRRVTQAKACLHLRVSHLGIQAWVQIPLLSNFCSVHAREEPTYILHGAVSVEGLCSWILSWSFKLGKYVEVPGGNHSDRCSTSCAEFLLASHQTTVSRNDRVGPQQIKDWNKSRELGVRYDTLRILLYGPCVRLVSNQWRIEYKSNPLSSTPHATWLLPNRTPRPR